MGGAVNKAAPFAILFANNRTATTVPLLLETSTAGFPVTPETKVGIARPP